MAKIIDGKAISLAIKDELKEKVAEYKNKGIEIKSFWESKINKIFIPYILITAIYGGG